MKLVADAIKAGIFNDLGSGSNVDLCVITKVAASCLSPVHLARWLPLLACSQIVALFFFQVVRIRFVCAGYAIRMVLR